MNTALFDRRIDVYMYDSTKLIGSVVTPSIGIKPEITVKGTMITNSANINSEIIITNLERSVPVEQTKYIYIEMYYGEANTATLRKGILFDVLYADQSKQPPDRQVRFACIVSSMSPNILTKKYSNKNGIYWFGHLDNKGLPIAYSLNAVLKDFIQLYNKVVRENVKSTELQPKLLLNPEPTYRMSESLKQKYANKQITCYATSSTLINILDEICRSIKDRTKSSESSVFQAYYALNIYVETNNLVVAVNPSYDHYLHPENKKEDVDLSYVVSAYRCGAIVHCTTLFDPRIMPNSVLKLSRNAILGRSLSGELIPIKETIYFTPINGIQYAFSTTKENYMQMQGVIVNE